MTAYVAFRSSNAAGQYATFYITNLGRTSYNGIQYRYVNANTGYNSPWQDISYLTIYSGYTSDFTISLTPGYGYYVYTRMNVSGTWYNGDPEPYYFLFNGPPPTPTASLNNASGDIAYVVASNYGNATGLMFKPNWTGVWDYRSVGQSSYAFKTPDYGYRGTIGVRAYNNYGESGDKIVDVYSQPRVPTIRDLGTFDGTSTIEIYTEGYFTSIDVEMWTDGAASLYSKKTISWNGNTRYTGTLTFSAMVPGARYQFRAIAYKEYNSGYGGWLYVINTVKPTTPLMRHHSSSGKTITMIIDNFYDADFLDFRPSWTSAVYRHPVGRVTYEFVAPAFGQEYVMSARGINGNGESGDKHSNVMTEPDVPSITGTAASNVASIKVSASGGFTNLQVEWWNKDATIHYDTKLATVSGATITFAGLVPGVTYLFQARSLKNASYGGYSPTSPYGGWLTLKNGVPRPTNWSWTTSINVNGHKVSGADFSMLATEWNDFTTIINSFLEHKDQPKRAFTTAARGNIFYFYMFNEANQAINAMKPTALGNVTTGQDVRAAYFNTLMNIMNEL